MKQEFEAVERQTLPPPADGIKFTIRATWAQPIGFVEHEDFSAPVELFEPTCTTDVMTVEPMFRIDAEDADCPAMFLAWAHVLTLWDPFQLIRIGAK